MNIPVTPCPSCGAQAPLVRRRQGTFCGRCGAPRSMPATVPLPQVGKPSKVGGALMRGLGWAALVSGLVFAAVIAWFLHWLFPSGSAWYIASGLIATLSMVTGWGFLRGGRELAESGEGAQRRARIEALTALAAGRGNVLRVSDVVAAGVMGQGEADALLTELAKKGEGVTLEVTDDGELVYLFGPNAHDPGRWRAPAGGGEAAAGKARVEPSASKARVEPAAGKARVEPDVIDAEIVDEEAEAPGRRQGR